MQKPIFFSPSTFIRVLALTTLAAGVMFLPVARPQQGSSSPAQQTPPSSPAQDSSAATPAKATAAKPDAKAVAKKPSASAHATKPSTSTDSQANAPAKASSAIGPTASHKPAPTSKTGPSASSASTKTGQAATTKTGKAGASKTATTKSAPALALNTPKDKTSYAIGINVGKGLNQNLKQAGLEIDPAILTRAIKDVLAGDKQLMTDEEAKTTLTALQTEMRNEQQEKAKQLAEANKKEGDEFLAANKAKEGVTTLPDGLQYKVLQEGTGPKPTPADSVTVNYRGTLLNGTEFDSSYKHGQPATFNVGQIIKGWTEALQLMPVGSKWQIFIPSDLAYGPSGNRGIAPNATLVFEVELLSIQPKPAAPAPAVAPASNPAPATAPANAPTPNPAPAPNASAPPKPTPPAPKPDAAPAPTPKPPTP